MVMSYLATIEMSYSGYAKMSSFGGGHDGRKGHDCGATGGAKAAACDSERVREGDETGEGGGGSLSQYKEIRRMVKRDVRNTTRGLSIDHPPILSAPGSGDLSHGLC